MAILRGQEALDYIRSNKGDYKLVSGDKSYDYKKPAIGSGNFFTNLARSIFVDPFAKLSESAGVLTNKALNSAFNENIGYQPIYDSVLGDTTTQRIEDNPYLEGAKGVAGIAALGVPGSAGVVGGLKTGAAAGALGGFGSSDDEDLISALGDAGVGALTGGAIGGAVGGVSNALSGKTKVGSGISRKLSNVADDLDEKAFVKRYGVKPSTVSEGGSKLIDKARKLGLTGAKDADELVKYSDDFLAEYGSVVRDQIDNLAQSGNPGAINKADILEPLLQQLDDKTLTDSQRKAIQAVIDDYQSTFPGQEVLSFKDAYNLKTAIGKQRNFNRAAQKLSKAELLDKMYWRADDLLDKNLASAGFKDFKQINNLVSDALDVNAYAQRASNKVDASQVVSLSDWLGAIAAGPQGVLLNQIGKNPESLSAISRILRAGDGVTLPNANIPARAAPSAGLFGSQMIEGAQDIQPAEQAQIDPLQVLGGANAGQLQVDPQQELAMLTLQLLGQTGDIGDASALAELLFTAKYGAMGGGAGGQEIASGEFARKALTAQQAGYEALRILESDPSVTGKTQGIENFFNDLTGAANNATTYNQQIETFRTLFMSALGGASLMPAEIERFEKSLPKVTDSPERARQKIEGLLPQLDNLIYKGGASSDQEDLLQMLGGY